MDQIPGSILTMSLAGGYLAKVCVDIISMAYPGRPSWAAPLAAVGFGILACALVTLTQIPATTALDRQMIATIIGAGILAAGAAIGVTASGNTAKAKRDESQAADATSPIGPKADAAEPHDSYGRMPPRSPRG